MLRVWNVTLVIMTFFLTIFGTFMTRSGVVQSVHAFGEDQALGLMFTVFMVAILVVSFGLVIYRLPLLQCAPRTRLVGVARGGVPGQQLDPAVLGAVRPVRDDVPDAVSEALMGERLTVGPPFFNKWMLPDRADRCCC